MRTVLVGLLAAVLGGVAPDASARFLSVDPVQANQRPGQNFNRYWYANNNPYKFTDPDGRDATWNLSPGNGGCPVGASTGWVGTGGM